MRLDPMRLNPMRLDLMRLDLMRLDPVGWTSTFADCLFKSSIMSALMDDGKYCCGLVFCKDIPWQSKSRAVKRVPFA